MAPLRESHASNLSLIQYDPQVFMLKRRQLIKVGIFGGLSLAGVRVLYGPFQQQEAAVKGDTGSYQFLSAEDRAILAALIPVILKGAIPKKLDQQKVNLELLKRLDQTLSGLPLTLQAEVQELLMLLRFPVTRRVIAGVWNSWSEASSDDIASFLDSWKESRISLLRAAYRALHELVLSSWYSHPASWPVIGYEGPPLRIS